MLKNIGIGWVATVATVAATFFLLPFVYRTLGEDGYGTWLLITAILAYLQQLLVGLPMTSVRYLAEDIANDDTAALNRTASTCAGLYSLMAAAALLIGVGLFFFFVAVYDIPAEWRTGSRIAFGLMMLHSALRFASLLPQALMAAHHDFVPRELAMLSVSVLRVVVTVVFLTLSASLVALAVVQLTLLAYEVGLLAFVVRRRYRALRLSFSDFDLSIVRRLFSFSFYVMLITTGGSLAYQADSLIIGAWEYVAVIPFYVTAASLLGYLFQFADGISQVVMPTATSLHARGQATELRELYMRWSKIAFSLSVLAAVYLFVLGPRFLAWWIDPLFEIPSGQVLRILMVAGLFRLPLYSVGQAMLMGIGKPRYPSVGVFVTSMANILLSLLLVGPLGLVGVALGTVIPHLLFSALLTAHACRQIGVTLGGFLRYVTVRPAIGAIPSIAVLLWFQRVLDVRDFVGLATAGVAMLLTFSMTTVFFIFRNDPYLDLRGRLVAYLGRGRGR